MAQAQCVSVPRYFPAFPLFLYYGIKFQNHAIAARGSPSGRLCLPDDAQFGFWMKKDALRAGGIVRCTVLHRPDFASRDQLLHRIQQVLDLKMHVRCTVLFGEGLPNCRHQFPVMNALLLPNLLSDDRQQIFLDYSEPNPLPFRSASFQCQHEHEKERQKDHPHQSGFQHPFPSFAGHVP